jgi:hypothetical protein
MANPFDQFDAAPTPTAAPPSGNPFDAVDAPVTASDAPPPAMEFETFKGELEKRVRQKGKDGRPKYSIEELVDWAPTVGHAINEPKALAQYARLARSGKWKQPLPITSEGTIEKPTRKDVSPIGSFLRSTVGGLTLDSADELDAALSAVGQTLWEGKPLAEAYRENWDANDALIRGDFENNPKASYAGYGLGMAGTMLVPGANIAKGANFMSRNAKLAALGGTEAGIATAMQNTPDNRFENVPTSIAIGAAAAPVLEPVVRAGARVAAGVANKTGLTDALDTAATKVNDWARKLGINDPEIWKRIPAEIKALAQRGGTGRPSCWY